MVAGSGGGVVGGGDVWSSFRSKLLKGYVLDKVIRMSVRW